MWLHTMRSPSREPGSLLGQKHNPKEEEGQLDDPKSLEVAVMRREPPTGSFASTPVRTTEGEVASQKVPPAVAKTVGDMAEDEHKLVVLDNGACTPEGNGASRLDDALEKSKSDTVANAVGDQARSGDFRSASGEVKDREVSSNKTVILTDACTSTAQEHSFSAHKSWGELVESFKNLSLSPEPLMVASVKEKNIFLCNIRNEIKYETLRQRLPTSHCAKQHWVTVTQSKTKGSETRRQFKENLAAVARLPLSKPSHVHSPRMMFFPKINSCTESPCIASTSQSQSSAERVPQRSSLKRRHPDEDAMAEWPSTFSQLAETFSALQVSSPSTKKRCFEANRSGGSPSIVPSSIASVTSPPNVHQQTAPDHHETGIPSPPPISPALDEAAKNAGLSDDQSHDHSPASVASQVAEVLAVLRQPYDLQDEQDVRSDSESDEDSSESDSESEEESSGSEDESEEEFSENDGESEDESSEEENSKSNKVDLAHTSLDKDPNTVQKINTATRITWCVKPVPLADTNQSMNFLENMPSSCARRRHVHRDTTPEWHPCSSDQTVNSTCRSILGKVCT